jgi:hypothetical protein
MEHDSCELADVVQVIHSGRRMWPFSRKTKDSPKGRRTSVSEALSQLANIGVHVRSGISNEDLLYSLEGTMESPVEWVQLLCVLGSEVERGDFERISDDIWHFDAECIEDHGAYVAVVNRFAILAKGALPLTEINDHVVINEKETWVEFTLDGERIHWDLQVSDDWVDPQLYSRLQQLVAQRGAGKRFFIVALGQDSLICFGDDQMRRELSRLSGLSFQWE